MNHVLGFQTQSHAVKVPSGVPTRLSCPGSQVEIIITEEVGRVQLGVQVTISRRPSWASELSTCPFLVLPSWTVTWRTGHWRLREVVPLPKLTQLRCGGAKIQTVLLHAYPDFASPSSPSQGTSDSPGLFSWSPGQAIPKPRVEAASVFLLPYLSFLLGQLLNAGLEATVLNSDGLVALRVPTCSAECKLIGYV